MRFLTHTRTVLVNLIHKTISVTLYRVGLTSRVIKEVLFVFCYCNLYKQEVDDDRREM